MNPQTNLNDTRDLKRLLTRQQFISGGLLLVVVIMAIGMARHTPKIILEPPTRASSISMQGDHVDANYLTEMGQYVANIMLSVTPANIETRQAEMLKWVHPTTFGAMQNRMTIAAKKVKESNATTMFWPTQVAPDPDNLRVSVIGSLETYVNGSHIAPDKLQSWMLQFESKGGRLLIKEWRETPLDDPLMLKPENVAKLAQAQLQNQVQSSTATSTQQEASRAN